MQDPQPPLLVTPPPNQKAWTKGPDWSTDKKTTPFSPYFFALELTLSEPVSQSGQPWVAALERVPSVTQSPEHKAGQSKLISVPQKGLVNPFDPSPVFSPGLKHGGLL